MFNRITSENIRSIQLPRESCLVNHSSFTEFKSDVLFRSFSIKYVVEGTESYRINGKNHQINENQFLLANHFSGGQLTIESTKPVQGICIDIAPSIISEVVSAIKMPEVYTSTCEFENFFTSDLFPENKYHIQDKKYGRLLNTITQRIITEKDTNLSLNNDFFYQLAEQIVLEEVQTYKIIRSIPSVKNYTKKEIFLQLQEAKKYIDTYFQSIDSITEIAQNCNMSEYHFYRHFKSFFKISPLQYLTQKKLLFAQELIQKTDFKIQEIAHITGFTDLPTFSKSFKKHLGIAPNHIRIKK